MMLCGHRSVLQPEQPTVMQTSLFSYAFSFVLEMLKVSHISCFVSWNVFRADRTEETVYHIFFTYILVVISASFLGSGYIKSLGSSSWLLIQLYIEQRRAVSLLALCSVVKNKNIEYYNLIQGWSIFMLGINPSAFEFEENIITCLSRSRASCCTGGDILEMLCFWLQYCWICHCSWNDLNLCECESSFPYDQLKGQPLSNRGGGKKRPK